MPKKIGLASRVDYPVRVQKKDGSSFILPPKKKTKKEFLSDELNKEGIDPKEVLIIK